LDHPSGFKQQYAVSSKILTVVEGLEDCLIKIEQKKMKRKNRQPLVSVIMPVYNAAEFLVEAIESVRKQTYKNWEMIVVNDGSNDETDEILKKFTGKDKRIKVISFSNNQGISRSLNWALEFASGDLIARMDGDDIALPNRFKFQVEYLKKNPKVVAVGGQAEMIDDKGIVFAEKRFPTDAKNLREMIMWAVPMQHPIVMARATAFGKYGYDERMRTAEDVDLFMKLLSDGEFGNVDEVVYQYRKTDMSNGYHDVKKTFYWTVWARIRGIVKFGYRPSLRGVMLFLLELGVVLLPAKSVVALYESQRLVWLKQKVEGILAPVLLKR